jgi:hypothetical protein
LSKFGKGDIFECSRIISNLFCKVNKKEYWHLMRYLTTKLSTFNDLFIVERKILVTWTH